LGETVLRERWETNQDLIHDWANHFQYLSLFLVGFVFVVRQEFADAVSRYRYMSLGLGVAAVTLLYSRYWLHWPDPSDGEMIFFRFLKSANRWWWLLALLGFARRYLNFSNPALRYATEAVYPFYILHQTVIICLAYPVINWIAPAGLKFLLISLGTFAVSWLLYEAVIRRTPFLRPLFGLKKAASDQRKTVREAVTTQL